MNHSAATPATAMLLLLLLLPVSSAGFVRLTVPVLYVVTMMPAPGERGSATSQAVSATRPPMACKKRTRREICWPREARHL